MAKIFQLEVTSDCNYTCSYCPRTAHMTRPIQTMSKETVMRVIEIMDDHQTAIRIHHYGESLLEKDLCYWTIRQLKASGKVDHVILNTNGSLLTKTIATQLFDSGLSHLNVSYHTQQSIVPLLDDRVIPLELRNKITVLRICDPEKVDSVRRQMKHLHDLGYNVELKKMRNLARIGCAPDATEDEKVPCAFLINNEWVILSNGDIGTCCHTFDKEGVIGNVWQPLEEIRALKSQAYRLCVGCSGYSNDGANDSEAIPLFDGMVSGIGSVVRSKG